MNPIEIHDIKNWSLQKIETYNWKAKFLENLHLPRDIRMAINNGKPFFTGKLDVVLGKIFHWREGNRACMCVHARTYFPFFHISSLLLLFSSPFQRTFRDLIWIRHQGDREKWQLVWTGLEFSQFFLRFLLGAGDAGTRPFSLSSFCERARLLFVLFSHEMNPFEKNLAWITRISILRNVKVNKERCERGKKRERYLVKWQMLRSMLGRKM